MLNLRDYFTDIEDNSPIEKKKTTTPMYVTVLRGSAGRFTHQFRAGIEQYVSDLQGLFPMVYMSRKLWLITWINSIKLTEKLPKDNRQRQTGHMTASTDEKNNVVERISVRNINDSSKTHFTYLS